ncbi:MAG: hypothetical protein V9G08_13535 [Dermatophilaceae bacterium]
MKTEPNDEILEELVELLVNAADRRYDLAFLLAKGISRAAQKYGSFRELVGWTTMAHIPSLDSFFELGHDMGESEVRLRRIRSYVETADLPMTVEAVARVTGIPVAVVARDLVELWQRGNIGTAGGNPPAYH